MSTTNQKSALISVFNKNRIDEIAKKLTDLNINIISTGGTEKFLKNLGYKVEKIEEITEYPSIFGGRVKTLHPKVFGGILYRRNVDQDLNEKNKFEIPTIDYVIVDLYPFEQTVNDSKSHSEIIEKIDIGGISLIRAAAKNYNDIVCISSINQYDDFIKDLNENDGVFSMESRKDYALKAFCISSSYDNLISEYFEKGALSKINNLRYGENPHQDAALYSLNNKNLINQIHGKKLSYNNYNDLFCALTISKTLPKNTGTVIVKHANPSGVSIKKKDIESYKNALKCDPISAFGGIVSFNFKLNKKLADEVIKNFYEIVIANGFEKSALKSLRKKKNLRIIDASNFKIQKSEIINSRLNELLIQSSDEIQIPHKEFKIVSKLKPSKKTLKELLFAFHICKFVKSNAIVITKDLSTIGIGSGQTSRLDSCEIAINKIKKFKNNSNFGDTCAASDAFFPFTDGIEKLVVSGVSSIIQPSGSIRDKDIIKFANKSGISLVFSKTRHFSH